MKFFAVLALMVSPAIAQPIPEMTSKAMIIELADQMKNASVRENGKIPYREAKAIELLFYRSPWLVKAAKDEIDYTVEIRNASVTYDASEQSLSYQGPRHQLTVKASDWNGLELDLDLLKKREDQIFDQVMVSRGYETQYLSENHPVTEGYSVDPVLDMTVGEKFDGSKWQLVPVRLISWPLQKLLYDLPGMVTSTVTESVSRSPLHNIQGSADEFKGTGKLFLNAFKDMGLGIAHPGRARFVDGMLELLDVPFKLGQATMSVLKSAISVVGYPIYRLFGGKKSQRVPLRGKRAVILLVDTDAGNSVLNGITDAYGDSIVRAKLKSISSYYCVRTNAEDIEVHDCIDQIPSDIQYLDFVTLQHGDGMNELENYANYATRTKGLRVELMLSIGCSDHPSRMVEGENTMGQKKKSWAVHYYLANMLEKRLRGIPAPEAAMQAFTEGFATNAVNPISIGGAVAVGVISHNLKDGYMGSTPDLLNSDSIVMAMIADLEENKMHPRTPPQAKAYLEKVSQLLIEKKIQLKSKTIRALKELEPIAQGIYLNKASSAGR